MFPNLFYAMEVILSIGSNCADKIDSVNKAVIWLSSLLSNIRKSGIYITPAAGNSKGDYANCVVAGDFNSDLDNLTRLCKTYEEAAGRNSKCRETGKVPVDIDIVVAEGNILKEWDFRQNFFRQGYQQIIPALVI